MDDDSRAGAYTVAQRLEKAREARDLALDWWLDCIRVKRTKGIAAAQDAYDKAETRVQWLKELGGEGESNTWVIKWADD